MPRYKVGRRKRLKDRSHSRPSGEKTTHRGFYYQTRSTMVPNSARFAGEYGHGLITVGGEVPETYREIFANFERERETGKDQPMPRMIEIRSPIPMTRTAPSM
jgi:alkanesulfonate monooxygenase SsuD/methylene tetrahydromethanopterin reductase-like flavin-dependent oxidoreductase (luciferase family)